ncbi:MAG TPA: hypothetical protein VGQ30_04760 [Gemmatimonadaceae bacterium]|jgi:hypothetical protein|nr:hypothetical protein [Gemmatimonadaceae bacterium]
MRPLFAAKLSQRRFAGFFSVFVVLCTAGVPVAARAQQWNDARTMSLVDVAIARRAAQLADTGLTNFHATAHGSLTFLAQLGEGFPDPPKVVRTDELAVEVYWRAPNESKQRIVGRRDTLLAPTDIQYHRDHLAIVQNNFPSIIRLGDGDEVQDVPHPLSSVGRTAYDYAITDSLTIRTNDRTFEVMMVSVRPKDVTQPRAVGAVYLDRSNGSVVRMTFSFTRAALKDRELEDVSVILENGLVDSRFWLPRRQEIEIRRTGSWLHFPARGIIRGRWEICCVQVNADLGAPLFQGPEIVSLPADRLQQYPFKGSILDAIPGDVKLTENDDVRRVQEEARTLVKGEALARVQQTALSVPAISDILRMNRVEGIAVGAGVTRSLGGGFSVGGHVRFGTGDHAFKEAIAAGWQRPGGAGVTISAHDDFLSAGDVAEVSGVRNTLAAQEFGADLTDYYRSRGVSVAITAGDFAGARWSVALDRDQQTALAVHAKPVSGSFQPAFAADSITAWRATLSAFHARSDGPFGSTLQLAASVSGARNNFDVSTAAQRTNWTGRLSLDAQIERAFGADRLELETTAAGVVGAGAPAQDLVYFGGPVTGPGYGYHALSGTTGLSQRVEWRHPAWSFRMPLGRFGSLPVPVTLAPFVQGIWTTGSSASALPADGWHESAGLGVLTLFDALRFDVARGLRRGNWMFGVDFARAFWRIL